ncbi:MAG: hypothetical protein DRJ40_11345 [Thermoprotei archaeon]|nr:MAG: hypothetical protein DRJ40_11345 [Thermoprotei archaeon]
MPYRITHLETLKKRIYVEVDELDNVFIVLESRARKLPTSKNVIKTLQRLLRVLKWIEPSIRILHRGRELELKEYLRHVATPHDIVPETCSRYVKVAEKILKLYGVDRIKEFLECNCFVVDACAAFMGKVLKALATLSGAYTVVRVVSRDCTDFEVLRIASELAKQYGNCVLITRDKWFIDKAASDINVVFINVPNTEESNLVRAFTELLACTSRS